MVGHTIPGVIGFQNIYGHLSLLQQLTDEDWDQILGFLRIVRYFFLENSLKPSSSTFRKSGVKPHIFMETREFTSTTTLSASAPAAVFTMFLVSTISVKFPFSSILQIPRVTPPFSGCT